MLNQMLKTFWKTRDSYVVVILVFSLYLASYLSIKYIFIDEVFEYFNDYFKYYITNYIDGDLGLLVETNTRRLFIEEELTGILGFQVIYKLTHYTTPFVLLMLSTPIVIFYVTFKLNNDFINNNASSVYSIRKGKSGFITRQFLSTYITQLIVNVLPRILFILMLVTFFGTNYSVIHTLDNTRIAGGTLFFFMIDFHPTITVLMDVVTLILYVSLYFVISLFSMMVTKNKNLSFVIYVLIIITMYFLYEALLFAFSSNIVFMPDIINQFSLYRFFSSFPQKPTNVMYLFQLVLISLWTYMAYDQFKKRKII